MTMRLLTALSILIIGSEGSFCGCPFCSPNAVKKTHGSLTSFVGDDLKAASPPDVNPSTDEGTVVPTVSFVRHLSSQTDCEDPAKKVPIVQLFYNDAGPQHSIEVPADGTIEDLLHEVRVQQGRPDSHEAVAWFQGTHLEDLDLPLSDAGIGPEASVGIMWRKKDIVLLFELLRLSFFD